MTLRLINILIAIVLLAGCARQTTPNGGPQDKIPPKLLNSKPANNEKNFSGKEIILQFNEDIKLKEPKEQIIISPSVGKDVTFLAKNDQVIIDLKTGLKDTTTYSISFREGIQDITESNSAENLQIAFSTGPTIDSLKLIGRVNDALVEKIPENITVAIYQSDTFNIYKHAPSFFTKTDKKGRFVINNLKPGAYRVYAFDDKNKNLKLETKTEQFGFLPGKINLPQTIDSLRILMIHMDARPLTLTSARHGAKSSTLKFNKALVNYTASIQNKHFLTAFGDDQSEVKFFYPETFEDSLAATIHGIDSLNQKIDTVLYLKIGKAPVVKQPLKIELKDININLETNHLTTQLRFTTPLTKINLDSVYIQVDSTTNLPITVADLHYDTLRHILDLDKTLEKSTMAIQTPMKLIIAKHSFITVDQDSSKLITKGFNIPKSEDTATLLLEVQTNKPDYVIQLLSTTNTIVRSVRNTQKFALKNLPPTDYKIRVLLDENNNDQWDPGNINDDKPPEQTLFYKNTKGQYNFPLRANWEVGPYIITF